MEVEGGRDSGPWIEGGESVASSLCGAEKRAGKVLSLETEQGIRRTSWRFRKRRACVCKVGVEQVEISDKAGFCNLEDRNRRPATGWREFVMRKRQKA
jgi:hypothetical protein